MGLCHRVLSGHLSFLETCRKFDEYQQPVWSEKLKEINSICKRIIVVSGRLNIALSQRFGKNSLPDVDPQDQCLVPSE